MKRYVIIGNGIAAAGCIEGIRSKDPQGAITVVSRERHPVYCRPLISYYLEGKATLEHMPYRPDDFYEKNGCSVLYGTDAVKILTEEKSVQLSDGSALPYDALCVAAGSDPFVPPFKGLDSVPKKHAFLTLDDALALEKDIDASSRVLIVGAGLIGLKCAEGICERVAEITVCDLADRVLSSILDQDCAALMQKHLEEHGIRFLLGTSVTSFEENSALMTNGETVPFDVLVLAVGVRANLSLVKDAGGQTQRGILVDTAMRTSLDSVFAAGDCAQGEDLSIGGEKRVLAILPNAYMQGVTAGVNMAGGEAVFDNAIPMNAIGFFGLHAMTAGSYEGECFEERTESSIRRLFTKDDLLKGFILIGQGERAGIYTSMIRNRIPLSSVDFERLKKTASMTVFSADQRKKTFGGVV